MRALNSGNQVAFIMLLLPSLGRKHSHAIERADCDEMNMSSKLQGLDKQSAFAPCDCDPQHVGKGLVWNQVCTSA